MSRRQKDPLRPLTADERAQLARISRSHSEPAAQVAHAKAVLAVADGQSFTAAARAAGRRSGDAVAQLVARFNRDGLAALGAEHGGGQPKRYTEAEQARILRALRRAPDGLPTVSTYTIGCVLHDAGFAWGKDRSWCETGTAVRKRKRGTVTVLDPDAGAKKT